MKAGTVRTWGWIHKWSSLVSMLFLLMLCVTGLPLIFKEEVEHWLDPHPPLAAVATGVPRPTTESMVARALAARPAGHVVPYTFYPADAPNVMTVTTAVTSNPSLDGNWEGLHFQVFDVRSGRLLADERESKSGLMYVMYRLHADMFGGLAGTLFIGAMGLLLFVAVVSGVILYAPFMRRFDFGVVRRNRGPRILWLDLHNLMGIVTMAWVAVVGLTGVINSLNIPLTMLWQSTDIAEMTAPYRHAPPLKNRVPLDVAIAAARVEVPGMRLASVGFPGRDLASPHHYMVLFTGQTALTARLLKPVLVDAATGKVTEARDMPWYMTALLVSQPLHFGNYGGLPFKIIWALLDVATIIVLASGLYLWIVRPRQDRPATEQAEPMIMETVE